MIVYCESVRHICLHSGPSKKQRNEEVTSKPVVAMSPPRKPSVTEPTSSARKDTTPASLPSSTPATTKITAQPPLEGTPAPQLSKMEQIRLRTREMRERREKKREGSAETQVPLPELPEPEVEVEGLLSEKKRQMIWTVVALAEQGAYREDWGNEELDEYLQTLYPIDYIYR